MRAVDESGREAHERLAEHGGQHGVSTGLARGQHGVSRSAGALAGLEERALTIRMSLSAAKHSIAGDAMVPAMRARLQTAIRAIQAREPSR